LGAGIPAISPRGAVFVRQPPLSVARLSDCRQLSVGRLRPVLRLARRLSDVVVFLSVGAVRLAKPEPEGGRQFPQRPSVAAWPAVCARRRIIDARDALSDLSADGERSGRCGLLAALARIAILAMRADVVLVAAAGRRLWRCCRASICAAAGQSPGPPRFGR